MKYRYLEDTLTPPPPPTDTLTHANANAYTTDIVHITIKTTNPRCRFYWCLIEFIDWRYSQSYWYFRPSFVNWRPSTFSSSPLPLPWVNLQIYTFCTMYKRGRRGWGYVESIYRRALYTVYLAKFRTYKIALPPQTKRMRGVGLRHLPPSPFTGQFLRKADT
jgi:hypothetical protein